MSPDALIAQIRECVPPEMLNWPVWLLWRAKKVPGKKDAKVPLYADGSERRGTLDAPEDRARLVPFEAAATALRGSDRAAGLGVALGPIPGTTHVLSGIDTDHAYRDGELHAAARALLEAAQSAYSERSVSGGGFHVLGLGDIGTTKFSDPTGQQPALEIYSGGRFFVMTGERLNGTGIMTDLAPVAATARRLLGPKANVHSTSTTDPPGSTHEEAQRILDALKRTGLYRAAGKGGKHLMRCPWEVRHTADARGNRSTSDSEACYFEPGTVVMKHGKEEPLRWGMFKCQHANCAERRLRDLKDFLGLNTPSAAALLTGPTAALGAHDAVHGQPYEAPLIVAGYLMADAAGFVGTGGAGKSTLLLYEGVMIRLGRALYGREVVRGGGATLVVTAEDEAAIVFSRINKLCTALNVTPTEREHVRTGIFVEDLSCAGDPRLVVADPEGSFVATALVQELQEKYSDQGLAQIIFDPTSHLGPGERHFNDGFTALMRRGHAIAKHLDCAARFAHHQSIAVTRGGIMDQHSGRGGAAFADNSRNQHQLVRVRERAFQFEGLTYRVPAEAQDSDFVEGNVLAILLHKLSYFKRSPHPIFLLRRGFEFRPMTVAFGEGPTPEEADAESCRNAERVWRVLARKGEQGFHCTGTDLEKTFACELKPMSRDQVRNGLLTARVKRWVVEEPLPQEECRGAKRTWWRAVPQDEWPQEEL